ncbi:MAG: SDR family NAD(P)-dependent oxidoreductase, partial [Myxococcota bacterium]
VTGAGADEPLETKLIIAEPPSEVSAELGEALPLSAGSPQAANPLLQHRMRGLTKARADDVARVIMRDPSKTFHFKEGIDVTELYNTPDNSRVSLAETQTAPGVTSALHELDVHEVQRVVSGSGVVELDGKKTPVGPGDVIVIPKGTEQRVTNTGDEPLVIDCVCTPRFTEEVYHHLQDSFVDSAVAARAASVVATVPAFGSPAKENHAGKVAVVTGGNRGLGFELCRQLALQGFSVLLTARDPARGEAAAAALRGEGHDVVFAPLDVTSDDDVRNLAGFCRDRYGRVDVLVNNAGINLDSTALDPMQKRMRSLEVNALGPIRVTDALAPLLEENGGRVINVSSELATTATTEPLFPAYQLSKSTLATESRLAASNLAARGIFLNVVDPGWVQTDMGGAGAPDTTVDGIQTTLWLATTGDPPSGGFFRRNKANPPPDGQVEISRAHW